MGLKHHTLENTIKQSHFNQVGLVKLRIYVLESSKKHETLAQTKERMRVCVCVLMLSLFSSGLQIFSAYKISEERK